MLVRNDSPPDPLLKITSQLVCDFLRFHRTVGIRHISAINIRFVGLRFVSCVSQAVMKRLPLYNDRSTVETYVRPYNYPIFTV